MDNSDLIYEDTWKSATQSVDTFLSFVSRHVFKRRELGTLMHRVFSIQKGLLPVTQLHKKVIMYRKTSEVFSTQKHFRTEPLSQATIVYAFLKALDSKVEDKIKKKMEMEGITETTEGALVWIKAECELIEQSVYPKGFPDRQQQKSNLNSINSGDDTTVNDQVEQNSAYMSFNQMEYDQNWSDSSWNEYSVFDEDGPSHQETCDANLYYMGQPKGKGKGKGSKGYKGFKGFKGGKGGSQFYTGNRGIPSNNNQSYTGNRGIPNWNNNSNNFNALLNPPPWQTAAADTGNTNVTDEVRKSWMKLGKCVNCGKSDHRLNRCPHPVTDRAAIRRAFNAITVELHNIMLHQQELTEENKAHINAMILYVTAVQEDLQSSPQSDTTAPTDESITTEMENQTESIQLMDVSHLNMMRV